MPRVNFFKKITIKKQTKI